MKKHNLFIFVLIAAIAVLGMAACDSYQNDDFSTSGNNNSALKGNNNDQGEDNNDQGKSGKPDPIETIHMDIQYIRSYIYLGPYDERHRTPGPYWLFKSATDPIDYIEALKASLEKNNFLRWEHILGPSLTAALNKYDAHFFQHNNLVMLYIAEGSGSIGHEAEITGTKDNALCITLKRFVPGMGTADMAYWHILVPVSKSVFNGDTVNVTATAIYLWEYY